MDESRFVVFPSEQFADDWLYHQAMRKNHPEDYPLIPVGIKDLDISFGGGLEKGQAVIVAGPPKGAKTTFLIHCALEMGQTHNVLVVSIEMNRTQLGNIVFSRMSGVSRTAIRSRTTTLDQDDMLEDAGSKIKGLKVWWHHGVASPGQVFDLIDKIEQEYGIIIDVVILDYFQIMEGDEGTRKQGLDLLNDMMRVLKARTIWTGREILLMIGSQINRESVRSKKWDAAGLLGTGALERYADVVLVVHDIPDPNNGDKPYPNRKGVDIVAAREMPNNNHTLLFDGATARFMQFSVPNVSARDRL